MNFLETLVPHVLISLGFLCCTALWIVTVIVAVTAMAVDEMLKITEVEL